MNTTTISRTAAKVRPLKPQMPDDPGHTPGPWATNAIYGNGKLTHWGINGVNKSGDQFVTGRILDVPRNVPNHDARTQEANARLIAAAPDLLAALRFALRRMERLDAEHLGKDDACEAARAAIAKATQP